MSRRQFVQRRLDLADSCIATGTRPACADVAGSGVAGLENQRNPAGESVGQMGMVEVQMQARVY